LVRLSQDDQHLAMQDVARGSELGEEARMLPGRRLQGGMGKPSGPILDCGQSPGLRMWGKTRPAGVYYQCQMTHQRSKQMPADHPATVHLAESRLNLAVLGFLGTAVFGPRSGALLAAQPGPAIKRLPNQHAAGWMSSGLRSRT
jgi:hypothetical protein